MRLVILSVLSVLLFGCGQQGALYFAKPAKPEAHNVASAPDEAKQPNKTSVARPLVQMGKAKSSS